MCLSSTPFIIELWRSLHPLLQSEHTLTVCNPWHTLCKRRYKHTHFHRWPLPRSDKNQPSNEGCTHTRAHTHTCSSHSQALWYRGQHKSQVCVFGLLVCVCVWSVFLCVTIFDFTQPANPLSIPCRSDTAFSRLRQLEAITLSQQTPACLHHTKKPCAHSAYYLCQRPCVCVCVWVHSKCLSMAIFLTLSQISPHAETFFFLVPLMHLCLRLRSRPTWINKEVRLQHVDLTLHQTA